MKNNLKYLLGLVLIALCASYAACKKNSDNTTVKGIVVDTVKNRVAANQKVIVVACYAGNFRRECGNLITSTITNTRGEFEMSFAAPNNPFGFEIRAGLDSNYYFSASPSEKVTPLKANTFTLYAREIGLLKATVKVNINPFNNMVISSGNTSHTLNSSSIDTTLYFRILPKAENKIIFTVWDPAFGKSRRLIDTIQIGLLDPTLYSKQILDTRNMPIR